MADGGDGQVLQFPLGHPHGPRPGDTYTVGATPTESPPPASQEDTAALLAERGKTHGPYKVHAGIAQEIKQTLSRYITWYNLTVEQRETLDMIAHKIGRIIAGDPNHVDHWDDIAGYAKLVSRSLQAGKSNG